MNGTTTLISDTAVAEEAYAEHIAVANVGYMADEDPSASSGYSVKEREDPEPDTIGTWYVEKREDAEPDNSGTWNVEEREDSDPENGGIWSVEKRKPPKAKPTGSNVGTKHM